ncbi:hypothetical protein [Streptomyces sp. NPDC056304]|uniref:hypothetical protein n=1 Tax=Streptomyces sp. NPDC056304 TaxID=3345778 RepID=UPI0035D72250
MTGRAILGALAAYAPPGTTLHLLETETLGLGVPCVPRAVARALVAADRRLGRDVGRGLLRFVRQVYRCLHHDIGERIRDEVRAEPHKPGSWVVVAHSLGSVIAFDTLTRDGIAPALRGSRPWSHVAPRRPGLLSAAVLGTTKALSDCRMESTG